MIIHCKSKLGIAIAAIGCALALVDQLPAAETDGHQIYYVDQLWVGDGTVIDDAAMVVQGGKITAVGKRSEVSVPDAAEVHPLGAVTLLPGLVIAETTLGEGGREEDESLTPYIRGVDGFDFFESREELLAAGITTVQVSPGSRRIMPGQGGVVKIAGDDPRSRTLSESDSLRVLLTQRAFDPPRIYEPPVGAVSVERPLEPTRPQLAGNLGDAIAGLRALFAAAKIERDSQDFVLDTLADLLERGVPIRVTAKSVGEITATLEIFEAVGAPLILVDADQITSLEDAVAWTDGMLRGIVLRTTGRPDRLEAIATASRDDPPQTEPWERVDMLARVGAIDRLAITADDEDLSDIWFLTARLLAADLTAPQLLACLTENPARVLGVDDRVGSLAVGKDADFVVMTGKPFESKSKIAATYVDGIRVYNRQSSDRITVVTADSVYAAAGEIPQGMVAIGGAKIRGVGSQLSYPVNATIRSFPGCVIVPGFVDMATEVGVGGRLGDRIGLNDKIGDLLVSQDDGTVLARQGGITTGLLYSSNLPSPMVAFKLGDRPRVLVDPVAIRFGLAGNLTTETAKLKGTLESGKKYADSWAQYDQAMVKYKKELADYEAAKAKYDAAVAEKKKQEDEAKSKQEKEAADEKPADGDKEKEKQSSTAEKDAEAEKSDSEKDQKQPAADAETKKPDSTKETSSPELVEPKKPDEPKKPRETSALEPYRALFAKKIPAIVEVGDAKAIELAAKLFTEDFDLRTTLAVAGTAYRAADQLDSDKVSVVVHPPLQTVFEGERIIAAERFVNAGIMTAIESRAGSGAKGLPGLVAYAVHNGLGPADAIAGLTTIPAELLGLDTVGSIKVDCDADLVVLSGQPFEPATRVVAVMIDGVWVYHAENFESNLGNDK
jgi:imidazolonepropionase-like amidohydrolase